MAKTLFFYSHNKKAGDMDNKHVFSQWYPCVFSDDDGQIYNSAEQYMMAHKAKLFNKTKKNDNILNSIMASSDQKTIKTLGRQIHGFDDDTWNKEKLKIVVQGNLFKFGQNAELKKILLATGTRRLVEASPYDSIWGIGFNEKTALVTPEKEWGKNLLGEALMIVRKKLLY